MFGGASRGGVSSPWDGPEHATIAQLTAHAPITRPRRTTAVLTIAERGSAGYESDARCAGDPGAPHAAGHPRSTPRYDTSGPTVPASGQAKTPRAGLPVVLSAAGRICLIA